MFNFMLLTGTTLPVSALVVANDSMNFTCYILRFLIEVRLLLYLIESIFIYTKMSFF